MVAPILMTSVSEAVVPVEPPKRCHECLGHRLTVQHLQRELQKARDDESEVKEDLKTILEALMDEIRDSKSKDVIILQLQQQLVKATECRKDSPTPQKFVDRLNQQTDHFRSQMSAWRIQKEESTARNAAMESLINNLRFKFTQAQSVFQENLQNTIQEAKKTEDVLKKARSMADGLLERKFKEANEECHAAKKELAHLTQALVHVENECAHLWNYHQKLRLEMEELKGTSEERKMAIEQMCENYDQLESKLEAKEKELVQRLMEVTKMEQENRRMAKKLVKTTKELMTLKGFDEYVSDAADSSLHNSTALDETPDEPEPKNCRKRKSTEKHSASRKLRRSMDG